jgi:rod shape-determining protein MreB
MINKFLGLFSKDLAIDLGTANTLVFVRGRGLVITEPSVVAVNNKTGQILAIGDDAKHMVGRTPTHISAVRPLINGVISDFDVAEKMIRYFIDKVHAEGLTLLPRPSVVIGVPAGATEVERRAVEEASRSAGAREVHVIEEPIAAAIGARLPISEAMGSMVVDIGGGTTEIAIISLGGVVTFRSLKIAGDRLNQNIIDYFKDELKLVIGEKTAEEIKINFGSAPGHKENKENKVRGRDALTGLPKEMVVSNAHIREALKKSVHQLVEAVQSVIESTPPELVADIMKRGAILCGGGSLLKGIGRYFEQHSSIPIKVVDDPLTTVARGLGLILEDLKSYEEITGNS